MDDKERVQNFTDMVNATEKLTKPWRLALIITNLMWAVVVFCLIWFAYMAPVDVSQDQNFSNQVQGQSYSVGVTTGD